MVSRRGIPVVSRGGTPLHLRERNLSVSGNGIFFCVDVDTRQLKERDRDYRLDVQVETIFPITAGMTAPVEYFCLLPQNKAQHKLSLRRRGQREVYRMPPLLLLLLQQPLLRLRLSIPRRLSIPPPLA